MRIPPQRRQPLLTRVLALDPPGWMLIVVHHLVDMTTQSHGTAVIIGASSGIGEALAHQLHTEGWRLVIMARRLDRLEAICQAPGPEKIVPCLDVACSPVATPFPGLGEKLGR